MVPVVLVFFFLALFDSVGTLVGVGEQAGLMRDGTLPRARQALLADAVGTVAGAALGTSTVTAYIESGAGVAAGGRTGLAEPRDRGAVPAVAVLLSAGPDDRRRVRRPATVTLYPVIAPPLILVGTMMIGGLRHVAWDDPTEAIPAFLTHHHDAAGGEHHRRRGVRPHRLRGPEGRRPAAAARCTRCSIVVCRRCSWRDTRFCGDEPGCTECV